MAITKVSVPDMIQGNLPYSRITGAPFNVLDYGADATGLTDSTTAIQAAITAANAAGGGEVFFPKGTYKAGTTTNIILQSKVTLNGEGAASIIKLADNTPISASTSLFASSNKSNISIQNLYFDGNRANQINLVGLFRIENSSHVIFNNNWFVDCNNVGIYFTNTATFGSVLNNIFIDSNGTNVKFGTDTTDCVVNNNLMYDTGAYSAHADGFVMSRFNTNRRIIIVNNIFRSPAGSGLVMAIWLLCGNSIEVNGNIFELDNISAVLLNAESAMTNISIVNNQLTNAVISISDTTPGFNITYVNISNNVIQQADITSIQIQPTFAGVFSYVCVNNNVLKGSMNGAADKAVLINAPHSTISNNLILMTGSSAGDGISNAAENVAISGNIINMSTVGSRGIVSTADYVSAIGNTVIGTVSYGIRMTAPANYCNVVGNTLRNCGLGILNGGANSITDNNIV